MKRLARKNVSEMTCFVLSQLECDVKPSVNSTRLMGAYVHAARCHYGRPA